MATEIMAGIMAMADMTTDTVEVIMAIVVIVITMMVLPLRLV